MCPESSCQTSTRNMPSFARRRPTAVGLWRVGDRSFAKAMQAGRQAGIFVIQGRGEQEEVDELDGDL